MLYLRFMTCLAVGLFGLGLMMVTVLDVVFMDWDVVREVQIWAARWARKQRQRYVLMEDEVGRAPHLSTRMAHPQRPPVEALLVRPAQAAPGVELPALPDRDLSAV